MILLDHQIQWPNIPKEIPPEYGLSRRKDFRFKQMLAIYLVSIGFSVAVEMYTLMGNFMHVNPRTPALWRAVKSLRENKILHSRNLILRNPKPVPLTVVHPTRQGRKLCHSLGWPPYETEWERMKRLHEKGKSEPEHTCATLAFTYQARLRGCRAGVVPEIETVGQFAPDAIVKECDQQVLVEVELGYEKINKWKNMNKVQGFVAFCTNSVTHRNTIKRECQSLGIPGRATDLRTLFLTSKDESPCPLWLDEWK